MGVVLTSNSYAEDRHDRRGFFKKLRDNYIAGRLEAAATKEEKRIIERREAERIHRRKLFDRNVRTLVTSVGKRIKKRPSYVWWGVAGGAVLVWWLCRKGSLGCERDRERVIDGTDTY